MGLLEGKKAIITGGSRGIGAKIVETFMNEGADVVFTFRSNEAMARDIEKQHGKEGQILMGIQSDASSFEQSEEVVKKALETMGTIDVLVNNAGITKDNLMLRMTEEQWDDVIHVNLKSVFNMTKHVIRPMLKNRSGSIINMSSVVGIFGNAGQANYSASKSGIHGFTKSIAKEVGSRGIRCNAIAPGFIETDMTNELDEKTKKSYTDIIPLKRFGSGQDIANGCVYLASDMGSYVTGQILSICGGMSM